MWRGYGWGGAGLGTRTAYLWGTGLRKGGWGGLKDRLYHGAFNRNFFDAFTLEPLGAPMPVGVVVANTDTYLPSVESPVATSLRGAFLATLDELGSVVIRDAISHELLATLTPPVLLTDEDAAHSAGTEHGLRPMRLRFLSDGLLVISDGAVERFRCPG